MVGGGVREFVNDADGPAFLEREQMGMCVWVPGGQSCVLVDRCPFKF